jgi:hypothetical protein
MSAEDRLKILNEAGPNVWIAIDENQAQIAGKGETYDAAVARAEEAGYNDPLVIRTPPAWAPMIL